MTSSPAPELLSGLLAEVPLRKPTGHPLGRGGSVCEMGRDARGQSRVTIDTMLESARSGLERLEPAAAHDAVRGGAILIDTRSDDVRVRDGSIPAALPLPLSVLEWRVAPDSPHRHPDVVDLDAHVVLICEHGYSSSLAAARLQQLGFARATDVIGGFEAWREAGLPVELQGP
jgi:rhodanese-related sulfurtransferase